MSNQSNPTQFTINYNKQFLAEEILANKAAQQVQTYRHQILQGKALPKWVHTLLDDLNRHPDMSMVAVGWLLQNKGVLSR